MGYLEANSYFFKEFLNVGAREPVWLSWLSLCLFLFFVFVDFSSCSSVSLPHPLYLSLSQKKNKKTKLKCCTTLQTKSWID